MGLLFLIGGLLLWGNLTNHEIVTQALQTEVSYYDLKDKVEIEKQGERIATFQPNGAAGLGLEVQTVHRDLPHWMHTLNTRYYRSSDYHLNFYTTGVNYYLVRPKSPLRIALGAELGIGKMTIYPFQHLGRVVETPGWEVHTAVSSYFVWWDHLWSYSVQPALRSYQFKFNGKRFVQDETIDGNGFAVSATLGVRF